MLDDVAERGEVPAHLTAMLSTAKLLERISGYAMALSEEVAHTYRRERPLWVDNSHSSAAAVGHKRT